MKVKYKIHAKCIKQRRSAMKMPKVQVIFYQFLKCASVKENKWKIKANIT